METFSLPELPWMMPYTLPSFVMIQEIYIAGIVNSVLGGRLSEMETKTRLSDLEKKYPVCSGAA
jgi:hypothetical protein